MKKEKKVLTKCVEAKKVKEFFNEISDLITSGHDKVWTSKDENGEMNLAQSETLGDCVKILIFA